ncbi:hypothetical protein [Bradyrhizobium sp. ORS 285]|uniref:hypothetical protein n=1 Tax=Bradyrhizobium sp. ORS 285 TaxID=115808 RepID=UPI001112746F|nr:hypothetical protein [Bradyrhizobium sp. ORS 285]
MLTRTVTWGYSGALGVVHASGAVSRNDRGRFGVLCSFSGLATDLWQFDFSSSRGGGQFLVNPANFAIPVSAGSPSTFNVVGANITIDAGGVLGTAHYT